MSTARSMLDTHPRDLVADADVLARCIDECYDCAETCTLCADADLGEDDLATLLRCVGLCLDCADVCASTGRVVSRQTEPDLDVMRAAVEACARACRSSGDECEKHAHHHEHCRICAESCRRCEQACLALLEALG